MLKHVQAMACIVTRLWAGGSGVQISASTKSVSVLRLVQTDSDVHSNSYSRGKSKVYPLQVRCGPEAG